VSGAEVFGLAFHIGARVAAKARAGEVLASSAVKDLMSKSDSASRIATFTNSKACRSDGACTGSNIKVSSKVETRFLQLIRRCD
jgi:class 3 adenylate cyclase